MNVAVWLERAARSRPDLPAVVFGDRIVSSYERFARRAAGLATALRESFGLSAGDRVAIVAKNHPAYLETLFAIWWAGLVAVPVNAKLHTSEIGWILEHASARAVFVSAELESGVGALDLPANAGLLTFDNSQYELMTESGPRRVAERAPDDLAWLFYTSGTTGRPKGAMISHRNLVAMSLGYLSEVDPTLPGDTLLHAAPMSHGSGLYSIPHVCRMAVNAVPESGSFEPGEILELIRRRPGTSLFAPPTMIRRMVDCPDEIDAEAIRTIVWGGAPMHVADTVRAIDRFGAHLAQIYGQGETPMTITVLGKADVADRSNPRWLNRLGSAGIPSSVVEVRVARDDQRPPQAGDVGEVLVRGETVMSGYWLDAEATELALRGGWLHTGDIGSFGDDGFLTLKDRSKDMIISGGSNIYPREVEEVLVSHPKVSEASVIGRPDPEWGEIVVAYVVGDADATEELDRLCLRRIARFKRPKDYVFVPSLPKSNNGKILKRELRALDLKRMNRPKEA